MIPAATRKAMREFLNNFDACAHTLKAIDDQARRFTVECDEMRAKIASLQSADVKAA